MPIKIEDEEFFCHHFRCFDNYLYFSNMCCQDNIKGIETLVQPACINLWRQAKRGRNPCKGKVHEHSNCNCCQFITYLSIRFKYNDDMTPSGFIAQQVHAIGWSINWLPMKKLTYGNYFWKGNQIRDGERSPLWNSNKPPDLANLLMVISFCRIAEMKWPSVISR